MLFQNENAFNREFLAASQAAGVPVSLLKGFAAVESAFNPKAILGEPSHNDASRGLLQILFTTAKGVGYKGTPDGLFDPATNLQFGALFIRKLLQKYPNLLDVIASYNAGFPRPASGTTPTIIRIYGKPLADWRYANQPYVDRVAAHVAYYQALEEADPDRARTVEALIKKKVLGMARGLLLNLSSASLVARALAPSSSSPSAESPRG